MTGIEGIVAISVIMGLAGVITSSDIKSDESTTLCFICAIIDKKQEIERDDEIFIEPRGNEPKEAP